MANRNDEINAARKMLDWLEENPKIPLPYQTVSHVVCFLEGDASEEIRQIQEILRVPGFWEKKFVGSYIELIRKFKSGDHELKLEINAHRNNVCTRRQVGTREIPPQNARTEAIYEYDCPKSLLALEDKTPGGE